MKGVPEDRREGPQKGGNAGFDDGQTPATAPEQQVENQLSP